MDIYQGHSVGLKRPQMVKILMLDQAENVFKFLFCDTSEKVSCPVKILIWAQFYQKGPT